jgi:HD-GYP domain-containing protein (c-di-GMP phosphodiesterase class II)
MSSPRHSDAPSHEPDLPGGGAAPRDEASTTRIRGEPLLDALAGHQPGSREHADATAAYAFAVAVEIGLGRADCELIREAARLHEIGKLYLPTSLLGRPMNELSTEERKQLVSQEAAGHSLALGAGVPEEPCSWILHSGERFDGGGPDRLAGESIPLASRIIRVACAYETLLGDQPASSPAEARRGALASLGAAGGAELDPALVEVLARVVQRAAGAGGGP